MNETEDPIEQPIEQDAEQDAEDHEDVTLNQAPRVRHGVGLVTVLGLSLLAGLGGAAGGWALTHYVYPPKMQVTDIAPLTTRVERAEVQLKSQMAQLNRLQSEQTAPILEGRAALDDFLATIDTRVSALETQPNKGIRWTAGPEDLLKNQNETHPQFNPDISPKMIGPIEAQIEALRARITKLEADMENARDIAATPQMITKTIKRSILLPEFPRAAMLAAMTAPRDTAQQGWLGRTLKKHISVRNPLDVARANATLDEIEALINATDYTAALGLIDALPSQVRSVAKSWSDAVRSDVVRRNVETESSDD